MILFFFKSFSFYLPQVDFQTAIAVLLLALAFLS